MVGWTCGITETQKLVRDAVREFAQTHLRPRASVFDRDEQVPMTVFKELAELGLMGMLVPEEHGGSNTGSVSYYLAVSEIAEACASTAVAMCVTNMVGEVLARYGTATMRERYHLSFCRGDFLGSFALSESEAGSDPASLRTTARVEGDGWILDGRKQWVTNGQDAGVFLVWARTGDGNSGLDCFAVDADTPGLRIGRHEDKMGLRGSSTVAVELDACRISSDRRLGQSGSGFRIAMAALDGGRIGIAAQSTGIARAALGEAVTYAKSRTQFGLPIADFQAIQWMIADSKVDLDAANALGLRAAWLKEQGMGFSKEASMAKLFASEAAWRICNRALQVHGGYGYCREFSVERHLRDVRVAQIYEGTSEIQRMVISRHVLA